MKKPAIVKNIIVIILIALVATFFLPFFSVCRNPDPGRQLRLGNSLVVFGLSTIALIVFLIRLYRHRKRNTPISTSSHEVFIVLCGLVMYLSGGTAFNCIWSSHIQYKNRLRNANIHFVGLAMQMYCEDNGGVFPPVNKWRKAVQPYAVYETSDSHNRNRTIHLQLANSEKADYAYGMNSQLECKRIDAVSKPNKTIMVFESTPSIISAHDSGSFPMPDEHTYRMFMFADGSVSYIMTHSDLAGIKWSLK